MIEVGQSRQDGSVVGEPAYLHGFISRSEAEQRLADFGSVDDSFLVRAREALSGQSYAVALLHAGRVSHHLLEQRSSRKPFRVNTERIDGCLTLEAAIEYLRAQRGPQVPAQLGRAVPRPEGDGAEA
jgi:hypothetical protein